jgi:hypothetical protein
MTGGGIAGILNHATKQRLDHDDFTDLKSSWLRLILRPAISPAISPTVPFTFSVR